MANIAQATTLRIKGIEGPLLQNVQAFIGPADETDRMSYRALAQHVDEQARDALRALGYYHPDIVMTRRGADENPECRVVIDAGIPVKIRRIHVQFVDGNAPEDMQLLAATAAPKAGDILHHGHYETFKTQLLQQAITLGYFQATWKVQEIRLDDEKNQADIALTLSLGQRHRFGEISAQGQGLAPDLVARFPRFKAGDWYNGDQVAELHRDLVRTGWFDTVRIHADPIAAQDLEIPVDVEYTPRLKNRVGIGAGYSTDVGPRGQLQWEKPWLNERGHSLQSWLEVSEIRSQIEATYLIPLRDPVTSQFAFIYGLQFENLNDHDYWLTTAGIEHRKQLSSHWRRTWSLNVERETDDFGSYETGYTFLLPGIAFSRREVEGSPLVINGWNTLAKLQIASEDLLSTNSLARFTVDAKGIYSLSDRARVLGRLGGGVLQVDNLLDVPVSMRFFAGGDQSVRGYDYESIAPRDTLGNLIGGKYLAQGSIELDYRFANRWLVATFADHGSAFNNGHDADFMTGVGAGIRWLSPVGPLRLDFAWGITSDADVMPFNIHFYMGPEL